MSVPVDPSTRVFARVEESLPIRVRPVSPDGAVELGRRLCASPTASEQPTEAAADRPAAASWERSALGTVLARLERLERLVEAIAARVGVEDAGDDEWRRGQTVNISGNGLAASLPEAIAEGSIVELELSLLGDPTTTVRALGRIASTVQPDGARLPVGRHVVGIAFTVINDADREAIVRYTFRLQRAQLRERRTDQS